MNAINAALKLDNAVSKSASSALDVFSRYAAKHKALDYTAKGLKWASNNVNPLICASGALKVAMSDDKLSAAITETGALAAMFAGERAMKAIFPSICKAGGKWGAILKGITFVAASIASYAAGHYMAKDIAKEVKASLS
jgi:hypothetical protein